MAITLADLYSARLDEVIRLQQDHLEGCDTFEDYKHSCGVIAGLRRARMEFIERWEKSQREENEG